MAQCVTKVELHISCRGLLDKDSTSKSDPLCAVYMQDVHGNWVEVRLRPLIVIVRNVCVMSLSCKTIVQQQSGRLIQKELQMKVRY